MHNPLRMGFVQSQRRLPQHVPNLHQVLPLPRQNHRL